MPQFCDSNVTVYCRKSSFFDTYYYIQVSVGSVLCLFSLLIMIGNVAGIYS